MPMLSGVYEFIEIIIERVRDTTNKTTRVHTTFMMCISHRLNQLVFELAC